MTGRARRGGGSPLANPDLGYVAFNLAIDRESAPPDPLEVRCPRCGARVGRRCRVRGTEVWYSHRRRELIAALPASDPRRARAAAPPMRPPTLQGLKRDFPHGTRAKYVIGCHCEPCTQANRAYARERYHAIRRGETNGIVDAARARRHLLRLRRAGVGRRAIAAASDVAPSMIAEIAQGRRPRIRAATARRLGYKAPALQLTRSRILARNELAIAKLWRSVR